MKLISKDTKLPHTVVITLIGDVRVLCYCSKSLIDAENDFWCSYYEAFGFNSVTEMRVGTSLDNIIKQMGKYVNSKTYFKDLFSGDHPLPVEVKTTSDDFGYEVNFNIEVLGDFDPSKLQLVKSTELSEFGIHYFIIGEYILYDGQRYNMTPESNEELNEAISLDDFDEFVVDKLGD